MGGNSLSQCTTYLANSLCGGSSRKLIAGWWYSILGLTIILMLMSFGVMSTRSVSEGFAAFWSGLMLSALSIGGTMIMRKFHNSMAVGFFMGSVVSTSQMFFLLSLLYMGYSKDHSEDEEGGGGGGSRQEETLMSFFSLCQSILLGSFAAILAAHRSEILDKSAGGNSTGPTSDGSVSELMDDSRVHRGGGSVNSTMLDTTGYTEHTGA